MRTRWMIASALMALLLSGCVATSAPGGTATSTTATPVVTATATTAPATPGATPGPGLVPTGTGWQRWHDPLGYQLSIPASLSYFPGQDDPALNGHSFTSRLDQPFAQLDIQALDQTGHHLCTQGTPTTVGHGIAAREDDQLTRPANTPSAPIYFRVSFVASGLDLTFTLRTALSAAEMQGQYGATWRAILDSFTPGPTVGHVQPCP